MCTNTTPLKTTSSTNHVCMGEGKIVRTILFSSSSLRGGAVRTLLSVGGEGQRHGGVVGQADEDNSLDGASYPVCVCVVCVCVCGVCVCVGGGGGGQMRQ